jgi:hypothetical protein
MEDAVRGTVLALIGGVFALLMVGLFFNISGGDLPIVEQVSSSDASVSSVTGDKGALLALLIVLVPGLVFGMGAGLYATFWYLNREVTRVQQQPNQQFELLSMGTEGNTAGAMIANNALMIVVGAGALMLAVTIAVLFFL